MSVCVCECVYVSVSVCVCSECMCVCSECVSEWVRLSSAHMLIMYETLLEREIRL